MTHQNRLLSKHVIASLFALSLIGVPQFGQAAEVGPKPPEQNWSFSGVTGLYDRAQLQRGFKVYKEVCSACHSMNLLKYRNLSEPGGPEFSEAQVKALTAELTAIDGPNDDGEMFERPAKPVDTFIAPYRNVQEAAASNNGKAPPDLSVIAKARGYERGFPLFLLDIVTGKSNQLGVDYLYALLTGYGEPHGGEEVPAGLHYNTYYPGHYIAMASPLSDEIVEYTDGYPQTVQQYAKDVSAFLMWAAEPKLEERKRIGFQVMIFLFIFIGLLYASNKRLWKSIKGQKN